MQISDQVLTLEKSYAKTKNILSIRRLCGHDAPSHNVFQTPASPVQMWSDISGKVGHIPQLMTTLYVIWEPPLWRITI